MKTFLTGAATVALLLSGCAPATEVAPSAPRIAAGAVKPDGRINGDPALWMLKDADTTIYLFGTVHVLRPDIDWFDGPVKTAFDASGELMLEMVEPEGAVAQTTVQRIAEDPDGPALTAKMGPALRAKYIAAMERAKLPVAGFEKLEPWFVASLLALLPLEQLGYSGNNGAEAVLTRTAKSSGKPIRGLETFEQQLGFFDGLPEPVQLRFLESTIDEQVNLAKSFATLIAQWSRGDADGLGAEITRQLRDIPEIGKVLLTDRNARWAAQLDDRMDQPGAVFVAVGAGHLAGADSVQRMLAKRGFTVTRLQ
ncbi:MAG TPA: TraB/GumN family protein [Sphingomonadaceae bacterium]|nr:TraB/GumN family protein [Sphingomonadaceae bacterium]